MLYPTFSNWWNSRKQAYHVANYDRVVSEMKDTEKEKMFDNAYAYNEALEQISSPFTNYNEIPGYDDILNISGSGMIGYVTIPKIGVELPIYHGTSAPVLNSAIGHLEGSSFPVGGSSTHAVLSGHRGLPSARLFTDLDRIAEGDQFTITILDEILTYEVDRIIIVLPDEIDKLSIVPGQDYVTLMTCTPYGINSHRLLVRGYRVDTVYPNNIPVFADAVQLDTMNVVPFVALPLFAGLIIFWIISSKRKKKITFDKFIEITDKHKKGGG